MKRAALGILVLSSLLAPGVALATPGDAWLRDACPDGRGVRVTNPRTGEVADVPCEDARAIIGLGRDAPDDRDFCQRFSRGIATINAREACDQHPDDPACETRAHGGLSLAPLLCEALP